MLKFEGDPIIPRVRKFIADHMPEQADCVCVWRALEVYPTRFYDVVAWNADAIPMAVFKGTVRDTPGGLLEMIKGGKVIQKVGE